MMKDKNGIEIKCGNCDAEAQRDCCLWNEERDKEGSDGCRKFFCPSYKACEDRIKTLQEENRRLQDNLMADKFNYECWEEVKEEHQKLEATISKLKKKLSKKEKELKKEQSILDISTENAQEELYVIEEPKFVKEIEADILREKNKELERENALLKDGKSYVIEAKMPPKFVKSIIRAVNSEIESLKNELRFTDEELDLIRKTFQEQIREDKDDWSAEKKIIAKCNELLKKRTK